MSDAIETGVADEKPLVDLLDEAARSLIGLVTREDAAVLPPDRIKAFAEVAKWQELQAKRAPKTPNNVTPFGQLKAKAEGRGK